MSLDKMNNILNFIIWKFTPILGFNVIIMDLTWKISILLTIATYITYISLEDVMRHHFRLRFTLRKLIMAIIWSIIYYQIYHRNGGNTFTKSILGGILMGFFIIASMLP